LRDAGAKLAVEFREQAIVRGLLPDAPVATPAPSADPPAPDPAAPAAEAPAAPPEQQTAPEQKPAAPPLPQALAPT